MSKKTFVYRDGKLVEKSEASRKAGLSIMRDIEPYQNMKDRGWITSRSQHREFLRRNNFVEVGNEQNHLL
jgi:hypothetical protein|tara:strand:+ start:5487 stop:5696 length:210 start_codon:yes stop_codon:yes gene_type:complete